MNIVKPVLEYLEEHLSSVHIEEAEERHMKALNYEEVDHLPLKVIGFEGPFKKKPFSDAFKNMEVMLYNELIDCVRGAELQDDTIMMIRANYGVGSLPSLFGLESRVIANTDLPWCDKAESIEQIKSIIAEGVPNLSTGYGDKLIETYEYYKEQLKPFSKCEELIKLYHPDLQGPFDVAHLIWGSDIFMALYDKPQMVHDLMQVVTDTYIAYMKRVKPYLNDEIKSGKFHYHWGSIFKGRVLLRNDASVNVSSTVYEEFIRPYDEQVLEAFGGGSTHFCGRADHNVFQMASAKNNLAMNFGYMPNIEFGETFLNMVKEKFQNNSIPVVDYNLSKEEYENYEFTFNTGISLVTYANTLEEAKKLYSKIE